MKLARLRGALLTAMLLGLMSSPAAAWELVENRLFINTYGTLGFARSDDDEAKVVNDRDQAIDDEPGAGFDSRIGLQLEYRIDDRWGVTWQGLAFKDGDSSYDLETKWAYLHVNATSWLLVRLGRFVNPFYQISEQRYVGYSQPWVRPPLEVYGTENDYDYSDGLWLSLTLPTTTVSTTVDVFVSQYKNDTGSFSFTLRPIHGAVLAVSKGNLSGRLMVARLPIDVEGDGLAPFQAALSQPEAEHDYRFNATLSFYNVGMYYDDYRWLGMFEYVQNRVNSYLYPETEAFTLTVGHYFDELLPYVVYSKRRALNIDPETGLTGLDGAIANRLIDNRKIDQSSLGIGLRWDVYPGVALKGQWDHVEVPSGHRGEFDREPDSPVNIVTLLVDWAF